MPLSKGPWITVTRVKYNESVVRAGGELNWKNKEIRPADLHGRLCPETHTQSCTQDFTVKPTLTGAAVNVADRNFVTRAIGGDGDANKGGMKVLKVLTVFLGILLVPAVSDRPVKLMAGVLCKATGHKAGSGHVGTMMATVPFDAQRNLLELFMHRERR